MIPYEDLCAALASYQARQRGESVPAYSRDSDTMHGDAHHDQTAFDAPDDLPPVEPHASVQFSGGGDEQTHVGGVQTVYEDRSNEIDVGDVLLDEENS